MSPWPIPEGFERLVHEHILRARGEEREELRAYDFPSGTSLCLRFPDGSSARFEHAFAIADPSRRLLAVFTEHCGYHVFPAEELEMSVEEAGRSADAE